MYISYDGAWNKTHSLVTLFLYFFYDEAREKSDSLVTLFFVCSLRWSKTKKFTLLQHFFLYDFYDVAIEKIHSVITLVFVCCLWWRKRKNSFSYNIIFCMLSMMEQEKNVILVQHYFLYNFYDGAREKTHSVRILFFVCCLWWTRGKHSICYNIFGFFWCCFWSRKKKNSFCYTIIFFMLSMMEEEEKVLLL